MRSELTRLGWMPKPGRKHLAPFGAGLAACAAVIALSALYVSRHVEQTAGPYLYDNVADLPARDVGLVLGTSRNRRTGLNEFYSARIEAAAELFRLGKVRHVIVSGSNPSRYYNEPAAMKEDLVARGVPEESITEDYAGYRTLDSIVRAHKVMGQQSFTVITQRFHAERAVYLGRHFHLDVIAYCAADPDDVLYTAHLREYGARIKALLDVTVLDTQPRYLGEPITIQTRPDGTVPNSARVD